MKGRRTDRLNSEFRKEIYDIIKNHLNNPLITEMFTISEVDVSPDIKNAKVYLSVYSKDQTKKDATYNAIKSSASEIRKLLGQKMRIRTVPELKFYTDGAFEYGDRIDTIISTFTYGEDNDDSGNM